jgi:hypothetical protein
MVAADDIGRVTQLNNELDQVTQGIYNLEEGDGQVVSISIVAPLVPSAMIPTEEYPETWSEEVLLFLKQRQNEIIRELQSLGVTDVAPEPKTPPMPPSPFPPPTAPSPPVLNPNVPQPQVQAAPPPRPAPKPQPKPAARKRK